MIKSVVIIIVLSIIVQLFTAAYAIRLIKHTKVLVSWLCVSSALLLMGVRRILTLYTYAKTSTHIVDPQFEAIGLVLSVLMLAGVLGLGRILIERKKNQQKIQNLLKEKDLLLKEVHHRIKNNMNTVCSLLELQGATVKDENSREIIANAGNRVRSMFHLYNRIYQSDNFQEVSTGDYFQSLIDEIIENSNSGDLNIARKLEIEDFRIDIQKIYYLGIIINELITNSIKYAFDGIQNPVLFITMKKDNETAYISVKDNGTGFSPDNKKIKNSGFGMKLIYNLIEELNAEILINSENGTETVMMIPVNQD